MNPILVSQRLVEIKEYTEVRECLDIRWGEFLEKCGFLQISISVNVNVKEYVDQLKPVGFILTGGNNLSSIKSNDYIGKMRDDFESYIIKLSIEEKIPLLGVCRGMQMIASFFDLSLKKVDNHVTEKHQIQIKRESFLSKFYSRKHTCNSYHDYSVASINNGLIISAFSKDDNSIEAIEHKKYALSGIMWHPERMNPYSNRDIEFFRNFFHRL